MLLNYSYVLCSSRLFASKVLVACGWHLNTQLRLEAWNYMKFASKCKCFVMLKYMKHIIWICLVLVSDLIWRIAGNRCDGMMSVCRIMLHWIHPHHLFHHLCVFSCNSTRQIVNCVKEKLRLKIPLINEFFFSIIWYMGPSLQCPDI